MTNDPQAVNLGHLQVDQRHIRSMLAELRQTLSAIDRFRYDLDSALGLQHETQAVPHERVVIRDQNSNRSPG
jgi:hypothetical protein